MDTFQTKKYCSGMVLAISPILYLKTGNIVFIEIRTKNHAMEYIGLTGDSISLHDTIKIGLSYKFIGLDQMILKGFQCHESDYTIFLGNSEVELIESPLCSVTESITISPLLNARTITYLNFSKIPEIISNLIYHNIGILSSCNAVTKAYDSIDIEVFMFRYIDVEGVVMKFFKDGWIEMETYLSTLSCDYFHLNQSKKNLFIYFAHHRGEGVDKFLQKGAVIRVQQVLPVFLWGTLQGFATTVRSNVSIINDPSLKNSTSLLTSNMKLTSTILQRFTISSQFRVRCSMYSAWRAFLTKFMMRLLNEKEGSTAGDLSKQIKKCPYNLVEIINKIEKIFLSRQAITMLSIHDRTVQMEFMNLTYGPLFTVRAGNDADWLSCHLPEFYSLSEVFGLCDPAMSLQSSSSSQEEASSQFRSINQLYFKVILEDIQMKALRCINNDDGGGDTSTPLLHDIVVMGRAKLISMNDHLLAFEISENNRLSTKSISVLLYLSTTENEEIATNKNVSDLSWEHSFGVTSRMVDQVVLLSINNPKSIIQSFFDRKGKNNHNHSLHDKSLDNSDINNNNNNNNQYLSPYENKYNNKRNHILIFKLVKQLNDILIIPLLEQQQQQQQQTQHPSEDKTHSFDSDKNHSSHFTPRESNNVISNTIPCIVRQSTPKIKKTNESITNSFNSTTTRSTGLSVRQVLMLNMSAQSKSNISLDVIGVILRMVPLTVAKYSSFSSDQSTSQSRLSSSSSSSPSSSSEYSERWMVTLRDEWMQDTIEMYLSLKELNIMMIGMVVCFRTISLCLSEASSKKKSLYLKFIQGRSSIVFLKMVPESQLQCLCKDFNWATDNILQIANNVVFSPTMLTFLKPPPFAYISHIISPNNSHSRCLWTILATIESLKSWKIYLRCKTCRKSVERRGGGWEKRKLSNIGKKITFPSDWVCKHCITDRLTDFEIWWLGVVKIGDGSSECMIFLEGENDVINALNPHPSLILHGNKFSRLKSLIKRAVYELGYVKYDTHYTDSFSHAQPHPTSLDSTIMFGNQVSGFTTNQQHDETDASSSSRNRNDKWLWEANKPQSYVSSNVGINKLALIAMQEFLSCCQFDCVLLEIQVRHAFPTFIDQFTDDINQPITKLVKMQRMCEDFPDRQTFRAEVATLCTPVKYLEVVHLKSSRKTDVTDIAHKLLNRIENK